MINQGALIPFRWAACHLSASYPLICSHLVDNHRPQFSEALRPIQMAYWKQNFADLSLACSVKKKMAALPYDDDSHQVPVFDPAICVLRLVQRSVLKRRLFQQELSRLVYALTSLARYGLQSPLVSSISERFRHLRLQRSERRFALRNRFTV